MTEDAPLQAPAATNPNILQRLHAACKDVDYIQKEKKGGLNYNIVSHDAVTAKVRPVLNKHGIVYYPVDVRRSQDGNRTQVDMTVRFCNIDDVNDFIDVMSCGYGVDGQDKGPGKALSYGVKYALLKALGLETGDDPDYDEIPHKPAQQQAKPAAPVQQNRWDSATIKSEIEKCRTKSDVLNLMTDLADVIGKLKDGQVIKDKAAAKIGEITGKPPVRRTEHAEAAASA